MGLIHSAPESQPGYMLLAPVSSRHTYLIDNSGQLRHRWTSNFRTGHAASLLPSGHLLRAANNGGAHFRAGGAGGRIEEFDWEGRLVWSFDYSDRGKRQHHDAISLPNGNVLFIAWQRRSFEEAVAAGRDPETIADGEIWSDSLVEVRPEGESGGTIVWQWDAWDHLVQDFDPAKANFGDVRRETGKIDINHFRSAGADWLHLNGIDHHPELDQVVVSSPFFNEIWVIDHGTTTAEAASDRGGSRGRGGDLLYRWGNPAAYRAGTGADQKLFFQHNPQWIDAGLPGAGNILVFNNGNGRPGGDYSSVDEIAPPVTESGGYLQDPDDTFGPHEAAWSFRASPQESFFAPFVSGAQRLPNGSTLVCDGPSGSVFEVAADGREVWRYTNPVGFSGPAVQGTNPDGNSLFRAIRYDGSNGRWAGRELPVLGTVEIPASHALRLTSVRREGPEVCVRWTCDPDQWYQVEHQAVLQAGSWQVVGTVRSIGTEAAFRDSDEERLRPRQGFYRVRAHP